MPTTALSGIRFEHVRSGIDRSIATPPRTHPDIVVDALAGYTEWAAQWAPRHLQHRISICWEWGVVCNLIVVANPAGIRTNLQLLDTDGRIESPLRARIHLLEQVEKLPWRQVVDGLIRARTEH